MGPSNNYGHWLSSKEIAHIRFSLILIVHTARIHEIVNYTMYSWVQDAIDNKEAWLQQKGPRFNTLCIVYWCVGRQLRRFKTSLATVHDEVHFVVVNPKTHLLRSCYDFTVQSLMWTRGFELVTLATILFMWPICIYRQVIDYESVVSAFIFHKRKSPSSHILSNLICSLVGMRDCLYGPHTQSRRILKPFQSRCSEGP